MLVFLTITIIIGNSCYVIDSEVTDSTCFATDGSYEYVYGPLVSAAGNCDGRPVGEARLNVGYMWLNKATCPTLLSWDAPVENEDGTALDDLAGFKVYCDIQQWDVPDPDATTFELDGNVAGLTQCAVTAYDTSGNESVQSNAVYVQGD